jgi:hypothetical protein
MEGARGTGHTHDVRFHVVRRRRRTGMGSESDALGREGERDRGSEPFSSAMCDGDRPAPTCRAWLPTPCSDPRTNSLVRGTEALFLVRSRWLDWTEQVS